MENPQNKINVALKKMHKEFAMKSQHSLSTTIFFLFLLMLFASSVWAQDMRAIKAQMLDRKPTIDILKNKGFIGEGHDGYLHFRHSFKDAERIVNAENKDRRAVNKIIAQKEGTTVEIVSKKLAKKLYEVAAPGQWLQKSDGSWYQKK